MIIDVNWRPVFFEDPEKAPEVVLPYVQQADILKLTDEEADWLLAIPPQEALDHPSKVAPAHVCCVYMGSTDVKGLLAAMQLCQCAAILHPAFPS